MGIEGVFEQGFTTLRLDKLINWTRTGSLWPMTLPRVLRGRDECTRCALRPRSFRNVFRPSPNIRRHDRRGDPVQQDGAALRKVYDQWPNRAGWISMGSCANGGGYYTIPTRWCAMRPQSCRWTSTSRVSADGGSAALRIVQLQNKIRRTNTIAR